MAIGLQNLTETYTANGSTTIFPFGFKIFFENQVRVVVDGLIQITGYTVSFYPSGIGGNVVFDEPPESGTNIRIYRFSEKIRTTDFIKSSSLDADVLDQDLDYLTSIVQETANYGIQINTDGTFDANGYEIRNVGYPYGANSAISKSYLDNVLVNAGNLPLATPFDDNKFVRVVNNTPFWDIIKITDLPYIPINKAGDSVNGNLTITGTLNVSGTTTLNNTTINGTANFTNVVTAPTQSVGTNNTRVSTTAFTNRASAVGGYTKQLVKTAHCSSSMAIIVDNKVFVSGRLASIVGRSSESTHIHYFTHVPFNNAWMIPDGTTIVDVGLFDVSLYCVLSNGWVYSMGLNTHGQLGHGNTNTYHIFHRIEFFVNNNISINKVWGPKNVYQGGNNGNYGFVFFRATNGNLYTCGYNAVGQLGIGNTTQQNTPVLVSNITNVTMMDVSSDAHGHVLAVSSNNPKQVWTWGYNAHGQLGNGNTTQQSSPAVRFTSTGGNIQQVIASCDTYYNGSAWSGGVGMSMFLVDGRIYSTGHNGSGQLGLGDTTNRSSFTIVPSLTNVSKIWSSGGFYSASYAIANGVLYSTGRNTLGQLGLGDTTNRSSFTATLINAALDVVSACHSTYETVLVRENGPYLRGFGYNGTGGAGVYVYDDACPWLLTVNLPKGNIVDMHIQQCGYNRYDTAAYCIMEDGSLWSWGSNAYRKLSNSDVENLNYCRAPALCVLPYK